MSELAKKLCVYALPLVLVLPLMMAAGLARADDAPPANDLTPDWYSLHIQGTSTMQGHPGFSSAIPNGGNSIKSRAQTAEGSDVTLFSGVKIGDLELYADPEMDQGYGVSDTVGLGGYVNGEAGKVGEHEPYFRMQRMFGRYVYGLGGDSKALESAPNQVATNYDANNVTLTFGKFSVVDVFDNNAYAHDPRSDFLNWSIIDMGAFDYAADAWGYTYGGSAEWNQDWWTLRGGLFDMSRVPNDRYLVRGFDEYQTVFEAEERHNISDNPGKVRALFFMSSAQMGSYDDAVTLGEQTDSIPNTALVRRRQVRPGGGLNAEQQIMPDLGAFMRASMNDGSKEAYEYTEINQSLSGGLSLQGTRWDRADDTIGLAGSINGISKDAQNYFAAGGQGILIGDGQLPSYAAEEIIEAYYKATIVKGISATADYQLAMNPAYDAVRGPINFFALRLHAGF